MANARTARPWAACGGPFGLGWHGVGGRISKARPRLVRVRECQAGPCRATVNRKFVAQWR
jgi:hypothetical protein